MVALWANEDDFSTEEINIEAYNIDTDLKFEKILPVKKVKSIYSKIYYDKRSFPNDEKDTGILTVLDGLEASNSIKKRISSVLNENLLGYMVVDSSGFDNPDLHSSLLVAGRYNGNGFYLRKDNYLEKLPMFAASRYITYNREWTERARIMKSADGAERFFRDVKNGKLTQYLLKCLLFSVLEMQNHMRSFNGSDGRYYRNELCFDTTNGETLASKDIQNLRLNEKEKVLISQWNIILENAKSTKNYNPHLTYGIYQIFAELDTSYKDEETEETIYDYPELHGNLQTLKKLIRDYYNTEIVPTLFEYEFLK